MSIIVLLQGHLGDVERALDIVYLPFLSGSCILLTDILTETRRWLRLRISSLLFVTMELEWSRPCTVGYSFPSCRCDSMFC